jgi:hypothetical protein
MKGGGGYAFFFRHKNFFSYFHYNILTRRAARLKPRSEPRRSGGISHSAAEKVGRDAQGIFIFYRRFFRGNAA